MKVLIYTLTFTLYFSISFSQSDSNAIARYLEAERHFEKDEYSASIAKLDQAETLLGSTNAKILYLRIRNLNAVYKTTPELRKKMDVALQNIIPFKSKTPKEKLEVLEEIERAFRLYGQQEADAYNKVAVNPTLQAIDEFNTSFPGTQYRQALDSLATIALNSGDEIFSKVDVESSYPGGSSEWVRFLLKNLDYPKEAIARSIQGAVVVQFIVDRNGNTSNIEAISGPAELRAASEKVIRKSGKWIPATLKGRNIKSYKKQPIVFKL